MATNPAYQDPRTRQPETATVSGPATAAPPSITAGGMTQVPPRPSITPAPAPTTAPAPTVPRQTAGGYPGTATPQPGMHTLTGTGSRSDGFLQVSNGPSATPSYGPGAPRIATDPSSAFTGTTAAPGSPPGAGLIGSVINPSTDPRLAATQGLVDHAAQSVGTGPDRYQLADTRYNDFIASHAPQDNELIRSIAQRAAATGRLGAGMTDDAYQETARNFADRNAIARSGYLTDATEGTIADRLNNLQALRGVEGDQYAYGANNRAEQRTERGYQTGLDQQAQQNYIDQTQLEEALTQGQFGREQSRADLLGRYGFGGNPAGTLLGAAGQYGQQGQDQMQALADALAQWGYSQGYQG